MLLRQHDLDSQVLFDSADFGHGADGVDERATFADDAAHIFSVDVQGVGETTGGLGLFHGNVFRMINQVDQDEFEEIFHGLRKVKRLV
jgi:hypothetical protein